MSKTTGGAADDLDSSAELAAELLRRRDEDQHVRGLLPDTGPWPSDVLERMRRIDADNTAFLKRVIAAHGWPGLSLVGRHAANAAWLIAQHSDADPEFQRHARDLIAEAVAKGEAPRRHLAYITDRCLVHEGQPQLYGTQYFDNGDGAGVRPRPIADLDRLDQRRAEAGLSPYAEHDARMRKRP
ncbi:DUF6624 domain-containing protein [Streptomyces millisiae]|uniref:Uncharacterized protein n=1 Tax=Streptomyces millisiae TaxID=3075542 RepID=A0ABU2LY60_9ACTN|nr:DUF6624 domain-containing protein [Streptomyces sp. DSM 44918]MDT0322092.1 hypothetical protein [Streptomyces sp. DSM 44918]